VVPHLIGNPNLEAAFLAVVRATADEIPHLIDVLITRGWAYADRIGIAGHSFGGFVTYAAVVRDKRLHAAAAIVGSPEWKLPWPDSPHRALHRFYPTALLSQTARHDTHIPPESVRALHQRLAPYYAQAPERLHYIEYPNSAHTLSAIDWDQAWQSVVEWFTRFLDGEETLTRTEGTSRPPEA
jgi:dienelactone hydrolase